MKVFLGLIDKIVFTCGVIVFLQLPHFIDQYTQRIGGYYSSQQQQLAEYQAIASNNYNGDLTQMIRAFKNSSERAVVETGEKVARTKTSVDALEKDIQVLENDPLGQKIWYLLSHLRMDIARGTLRVFQPGVPLSLWAFAYGLVGGVVFSLLFNGLVRTPGAVHRRIQRRGTNRARA